MTYAGKCSVPMWIMGSPAGFCGEPAWGVLIEGERFRNAWNGEMRRLDGKWDGYASGLCCPKHSGPTEFGPRVFEDGNDAEGYRMWCAVYPDFINLQQSPAEFHRHAWVAVKRLLANHPRKTTQ